MILSNVRQVKVSSPDYASIKDKTDAIKDFINRIKNYEKSYQPLDATEEESNLSWIKLIDLGKCICVNYIKNYLQSRIALFLMNLHIGTRSIYMCRVMNENI